MRICDVCSKPAAEEIRFKSDDHSVDLCAEHRQKILELLVEPPKRGRPRKNSDIPSE